MLSRHANSSFWLGRYVERAEATARSIDVHYHFGLESSLVGGALRWSSILAISGSEKEFALRYDELTERNIVQFFSFDPENSSSIYSCLKSARDNARAIRDQISSEMWECINRIFLDYQSWNVDRVLWKSPHLFFQQVKEGSHLFQGIADRTLLTSETRDFFQTGRFLERADQTARILDVKYHDLLPRFSARDGQAQGQVTGGMIQTQGPDGSIQLLADPFDVGGPIDVHGWTAVLKSVGAFEAFRKTYRLGVTPALVAQFLILNGKFPASVRYSIGRVDRSLRRVSGNNDLAPANWAEREVGKLYNDLNFLKAEEIILLGLHEYLEGVQSRCSQIGDAIYETYLSY